MDETLVVIKFIWETFEMNIVLGAILAFYGVSWGYNAFKSWGGSGGASE